MFWYIYATEKVVENSLNRKQAVERWRTVDVLVVDEVSMMSGDLFDKV